MGARLQYWEWLRTMSLGQEGHVAPIRTPYRAACW